MSSANNIFLILHLQSAQLHLREIAECADEMEGMLRREKDRLKRRVERAASQIEDAEVRSIYYEDAAEEWTQLTRTFPEIIRSAFFIKSYSAFETYLIHVAQAHQKREGICIALSDLKGDGISKAKLYFTKVARLPFPAECDLWSHLNQVAEIRNYVVHADSVVRPDKVEHVRNFVTSSFPEIEMDDNGKVQFSEGACAHLIDICDGFLKQFRMRLQ